MMSATHCGSSLAHAWTRRVCAVLSLAGALVAASGVASAQSHEEHARPMPGAPPPPAAVLHDPHAGMPGMPGRPGHAMQHAPGAHPEHAEAAGHEHDESAPPEGINWFHGILGEKKGVAPNLLWRAPGESPPFVATIFNFGVLVFLFLRYGRKPLAQALVKRKADIMHELDEARAMREAAEKRLAEYEARLGTLDAEMERICKEFREQGERDRERIIREARERGASMRAEAGLRLTQELELMQKGLIAETVETAVRAASELVRERATSSDHDRFAEVFLTQLRGREKSASSFPGADVPVKGGLS